MRSSGDIVTLRNVWFGRPRAAAPAVVIEDSGTRLAVWIPRGCTYQGPEPRGVPTEWELHAGMWEDSCVVVHYYGESWIASHKRPEGAAAWWYVDVVDAVRRSPVGLDHRDLFLDVVSDPSVQIIDQDELAEALRLGVLSTEEAEGAERAAAKVVSLLEHGRPPFDGAWDAWAPPADWPLPALPRGWDVV